MKVPLLLLLWITSNKIRVIEKFLLACTFGSPLIGQNLLSERDSRKQFGSCLQSALPNAA
jgi:hypothetical protein